VAVRKIRLLGDPILRAKCKAVTNYASPDVRKTVRDLRDTLADFRLRNRFGRGIAAPQIGRTLRVVYIRTAGLGPLINPRITGRSKRMFKVWDDCFSFPGLLIQVRRHTSIEVTFRDAEGNRKSIQASYALSELLQHEIDHLNGILAIDRAISPRSIILRSELKRPA
jgi:peptide deformylase